MTPDDCARIDGPLVVTSGAGIAVATDAMLAHLADLVRIAAELEGHAGVLRGLADGPPGETAARLSEEAAALAAALADELRLTARALTTAVAAYSLADRVAASLQDALAGWVASLLPQVLLAFTGPVVGGAAAAWFLAPGTAEEKRASLQRWILDNPQLVTSPEFSDLVRHIVMGADDAALGAFGVPAPLIAILGDQGLGLLGVGTSATALLGAGALSGTAFFRETAVRVHRLDEVAGGRAPMGAADRLDRVPGAEQVRIERYDAPGAPSRFIVYIAPTQTFSPAAETEPWDLTSNVAGVAGLPAGSIRATQLAMADAGITADSEIVLVGYSQGGLVADALAASGSWNTVGLETYGDPGGGFDIPGDVRGIAIRHSDDFVVATGGAQQPTERVIVERQAYPEVARMPTDAPVPAHQRNAYAATAELLDAARSPVIRDELAALRAFTDDHLRRDGATMTVLRYRAERISASSS